MLQIADQIGHQLVLPNPPQRIISVVPSQTELLYHLGLNDEVIAITKFCIHPHHWFTSKIRIGGTKTVDLQKVLALKPDLVIANKEENTREQVQTLQQHVPVYTSNIITLDDALHMIADVGTLTAKQFEARSIVMAIREGFTALQQHETSAHSTAPIRAAYLIWKNPWMAAGGDTFIHNMMEQCGFENVFAESERYPTTTVEQLSAKACNVLLLSSEPYPFKQKHINELQQHLPGTSIMFVDGEMFSWYGSRLRLAVKYFIGLRELLLTKPVH